MNGQAGAVRLGIARALVAFNAELRKAAEEGRAADVGFARQGTEEVRSGWRAQALPVQQALGEGEGILSGIATKDLLEAGVHFGHQTKRWNPKMKPYIFGERNGIYIIDLNKTAQQVPRGRGVRHQPGRRRPHAALRGHQAAGAGRDRRRSAALRDVLHQPALAGRPADQLHDHPAQPGAPPRPRGDGHRRPLRVAVEEGDRPQREGEAQAAEEPRRHPAHVAAARRDLRRRHRQGEDCRRRGAQAEDSGDRHRRHQLPIPTRWTT